MSDFPLAHAMRLRAGSMQPHRPLSNSSWQQATWVIYLTTRVTVGHPAAATPNHSQPLRTHFHTRDDLTGRPHGAAQAIGYVYDRGPPLEQLADTRQRWQIAARASQVSRCARRTPTLVALRWTSRWMLWSQCRANRLKLESRMFRLSLLLRLPRLMRASNGSRPFV